MGWVSTARILDAREAATLRWASRYAIEYFDPTHEPGNPTVLVVRTILRNSVFNNHAAHMRDQKNRLCMVCFYLPLHFKRILLTILTCPPHILTF